MAIGLRLDLRQTQQLVMTPQLQQAIRLLAMSHVELNEFLTDEVEKNPLLSLEESEPDPDVEAAESVIPPTDGVSGDMDLMRRTFDTGTENLVDNSPSDGPSPLQTPATGAVASYPEQPGYEAGLPVAFNLTEHLRSEIAEARAPAEIRELARRLVWELDDDGYLRVPMEELVEHTGASSTSLQAAVSLLQQCSPTGVGARNLTECFGLQLAERGRLDPMMRAFLTHLELLTEGRIGQLQRKCGASDEDFQGMLAELRTLDPRPCARLAASPMQTVVPDILLSRPPDGGYAVELNPETLPRVLVDRDYRALLGRKGCKETEVYLSECLANASWITKSLDQRARTILKVSTEIVRRQEAFLEHGIAHLAPMTLRDVADAVQIHESTASRVTSNKYIATPHGVLELKFFFTNAVGDEATSAAAVRHRIREMVASEVTTGVLSDDAIVSRLSQDGIEIARRTVAKYRKSLNIPSSSQRRRAAALATIR